MAGAFLTGLYTFRLFFLVFWGEPSPFVREHLMTGSHAHAREGHAEHDGHETHMHAGEGPFSMTSTVAVLAVLAAFGGWIQFADLWTPITNWLDPVAPPLVDASGAQEAISSVVAVLLGLAGIGVAWWIYGARRATAPRSWRVLEHKFYFDEAYDALFYRPVRTAGAQGCCAGSSSRSSSARSARSRRASATSASARAACRPGSCARTCSRSPRASPS